MAFRSLACRLIAGAATVLLCVSCGGGGSGSSGPEDHRAPAQTVAENVSLAWGATTPLTWEGWANEAPFPKSFEVAPQGDLRLLNGYTVYLYVGLPEADVFHTPEIYFPGAYAEIWLMPNGSAWTAAEQHEGSVQVYACLDEACGTQLGGSPLSVPYQIHPKRPFDVENHFRTVQVALGTPRVTDTFAVTAGDTGSDWYVLDGEDIAHREGDVLVMDIPVYQVPGVYTRTVRVATRTPGPGGGTRSAILEYEVLPTESFPRPESKHLLRYGNATWLEGVPDMAQGGSRFVITGIGNGYVPDAPGGNGSAGWLRTAFNKNAYEVSACPDPAYCLPQGSYTSWVFGDLWRADGSYVGSTRYPVTITVQR